MFGNQVWFQLGAQFSPMAAFFHLLTSFLYWKIHFELQNSVTRKTNSDGFNGTQLASSQRVKITYLGKHYWDSEDLEFRYNIGFMLVSMNCILDQTINIYLQNHWKLYLHHCRICKIIYTWLGKMKAVESWVVQIVQNNLILRIIQTKSHIWKSKLKWLNWALGVFKKDGWPFSNELIWLNMSMACAGN